jgi:hypothetical protein
MLDGDHKMLVDAVLPVCAEYGLAIAGGYAVKAHGLVDRPSEDIDFATSSSSSIEEIMAALAAAYRDDGHGVQVLDVDARKGHLLVTLRRDRTYRVDVLKEPLNHPVAWMEFGPVIALADAVALKMGALHDRAMPRDLLDVHGAAAHFTTTEMIALCRTVLGEEFSLETMRDQLDFAATYPEEAFARYGSSPELIAEAKRWAQAWSTELGQAIAEAESWTDDDGWDEA